MVAQQAPPSVGLQARTLEWVAISFSNAWKWKVKAKVKSCLTPSDPMDYSLPGSSVHGIFQATVLEWGAKLRGRSHKKHDQSSWKSLKSGYLRAKAHSPLFWDSSSRYKWSVISFPSSSSIINKPATWTLLILSLVWVHIGELVCVQHIGNLVLYFLNQITSFL